MKRGIFTTGLTGTVVTAICCFTPLLAVVFGMLGISAWLGWVDIVLLPLLLFFVVLAIHGARPARKGDCHE